MGPHLLKLLFLINFQKTHSSLNADKTTFTLYLHYFNFLPLLLFQIQAQTHVLLTTSPGCETRLHPLLRMYTSVKHLITSSTCTCRLVQFNAAINLKPSSCHSSFHLGKLGFEDARYSTESDRSDSEPRTMRDALYLLAEVISDQRVSGHSIAL